jgi:peptide/nickel transport system permease protein
MVKFILHKIGYALAVLTGVVVVIFSLFSILPSDPARMTQGQRSDVQSLEAVRKEFGLDKPVALQFVLYLNDLLPISIHDTDAITQAKYKYLKVIHLGAKKALVLKYPYLRRSYQTKRKVTAILAETVPNTMILASAAMIMATVFGIFLGVIAAVYKNTWVDQSAIAVSILGVSAPSFFAGIIIAWLFGFVLSDYTGLHMSGSLYDYDPFEGKILVLKNLILPVFTLGLRPLAIIMQLTRSALLDVLQQDYIRTAKAKGLSTKRIIIHHALKNALNPVVTAVSGWFASLLAGSFFIEYIFGFNGLGKATVDALELADLPVVMGAILFIAFIFVIINILADLLYISLDPRVKLNG